jgi:hypothetical protein
MLSIRTSAGTRIERGLHEPYRAVLHALKSLCAAKVVDPLKVTLTNEDEDMSVEHLRAIRDFQLNQCVENVAAHTAHVRRAYICRYEGDGVKRGWYVTRY